MSAKSFVVLLACLLVASTALADAHARRATIAHLTSAELRAVHASLARAVATARRAAPGGGRAGRTYEERAYRLGAATTDEARVVDMAHTWLHPDPDDEAWFERVAPVAADPAAIVSHLGAAPDAPFALPVSSGEAAARDALARSLASAAHDHLGLHVLSLECGWGDVVGGAYLGVAFVDDTTHEALWVLSHETWNDE